MHLRTAIDGESKELQVAKVRQEREKQHSSGKSAPANYPILVIPEIICASKITQTEQVAITVNKKMRT